MNGKRRERKRKVEEEGKGGRLIKGERKLRWRRGKKGKRERGRGEKRHE